MSHTWLKKELQAELGEISKLLKLPGNSKQRVDNLMERRRKIINKVKELEKNGSRRY